MSAPSDRDPVRPADATTLGRSYDRPVRADVEPPYANKPKVNALALVTTAVVMFFATGQEIEFEQEGVLAIGGGVATLLVYLASNFKKALLGLGKK